MPNDRGNSSNIFNLTKAQLAARKIEFLDIADSSKLDAKSYNEDEDPSIFKSTRTNRGPFRPGRWFETAEPVTCAYKLVTVEFGYKAFKSRIESYIHDIIAPIYVKTHRQSVCWMDEWIHLSAAEIRKLDLQIGQKLIRQSAPPAVSCEAASSTTRSVATAKTAEAVIKKTEDSEPKEVESSQTPPPRNTTPNAPLPKGSFLKLRERLHLRAKM